MSDDHKDDDVIKVGLTIAVFILFSIIFWIYFHAQISSGVRWIRVGQIYIIRLFTDHYNDLQYQLIHLHPEQVTPHYLSYSTQAVMQFFKLPILCILGVYSVASFFLKFDSKFTRKMGLEQIIEEHSKAFPVISPITKFNPLKSGYRTLGDPVPSKMAPFAEALTPEEWVAYKAIPMPNNMLDIATTKKCFLRQLGRRWRSPQHLPLHMKVLYVAFAMKGNGMRKESDQFLADLAQCWDPKRGLKLTKPLKKIIAKEIDNPRTGRVMAKIALQHAFTTTAMMRLLQTARDQGGVLAPAQFVWLRAINRHLWYALNNLGRAAVHMEAAGSTSHYRAEKSSNKPIPNPQVDGAVEGLTNYLRENGYTGNNPTNSIPPRDYRGEGHGSGARAPI